MTVTSNTLLQIDATIITGLIILLTLQSVSTPLWQKQVDDYVTTLRDLRIQIGAINDMMKEYCSENTNSSINSILGNTTDIQTRCNAWALQSDELDKRVENWNDYGKNIGLDINGTFVPSVATSNTVRANYLVDQIAIVMIVLFGISMLIEIISKFKKTDRHDASTLAMVCTSCAFAVLIGGFLYIFFVIGCSNSFSVQNWCPRF
jgi:hypothetical protein